VLSKVVPPRQKFGDIDSLVRRISKVLPNGAQSRGRREQYKRVQGEGRQAPVRKQALDHGVHQLARKAQQVLYCRKAFVAPVLACGEAKKQRYAAHMSTAAA